MTPAPLAELCSKVLYLKGLCERTRLPVHASHH